MTVPNVQSVIDLLFKFTTPEDVADYLRTEGVKGHLRNFNGCPISNLLKRGRNLPYVTVSPNYIVFESAFEDSYQYVRARNASAVRTFIREFDEGKYPDLIYPTDNAQEEGA